jgi:hypothetical protein
MDLEIVLSIQLGYLWLSSSTYLKHNKSITTNITYYTNSHTQKVNIKVESLGLWLNLIIK